LVGQLNFPMTTPVPGQAEAFSSIIYRRHINVLPASSVAHFRRGWKMNT